MTAFKKTKIQGVYKYEPSPVKQKIFFLVHADYKIAINLKSHLTNVAFDYVTSVDTLINVLPAIQQEEITLLIDINMLQNNTLTEIKKIAPDIPIILLIENEQLIKTKAQKKMITSFICGKTTDTKNIADQIKKWA